MKALALAALLLAGTAPAQSPAQPASQPVTPGLHTPASNGMIKVAFVIGEHANLMDLAGSWEVFRDTMLDDGTPDGIMPFAVYTVAGSAKTLHIGGGDHGGLPVTADYTFADVPEPDIIVVGAQSGAPGLSDWLRKMHGRHRIIMSVCTGAFRLADAGLLDGKPATTHHWYFGDFARQYPAVKLVREVRYVQADPTTYTAGGLTSGVDLSLHIVAEYFGTQQAQRTADYLEYQGMGWRSNQGVSVLTTPVTQQDWSGRLASGRRVVLHLTTTGASTVATAELPGAAGVAVPVTIDSNGNKVRLSMAQAGHPALFTGQVNRDETRIAGTLTQDGQSYRLTLERQASRPD